MTGKWIEKGGWKVWVWTDFQLRGTGKFQNIAGLRSEVNEMRDMSRAEYEAKAQEIVHSGWLREFAVQS